MLDHCDYLPEEGPSAVSAGKNEGAQEGDFKRKRVSGWFQVNDQQSSKFSVILLRQARMSYVWENLGFSLLVGGGRITEF